MGYSNALAKCMIYDRVVHQFIVVAQMDFHKRCILVTKMVKVDFETGISMLFCFTAGTDGLVAIWHIHPSSSKDDIKLLQMPLISFQTHQSGVNCLDIFILEGNIYIIYSKHRLRETTALTISMQRL